MQGGCLEGCGIYGIVLLTTRGCYAWTEGEWRRWSEPAGVIHQAVSEILVATQYAKEMAGIISETLEEDRVVEAKAAAEDAGNSKPKARRILPSKEGAATAPGPPRKVLVKRSQTKSLTEKKIASKAAHKFKGIFPYEGSPDSTLHNARSDKSEFSVSPSSQAKRDMCPKAKDIKRPTSPKVTTSLVNRDSVTHTKDAASGLPGKKGLSGARAAQKSVKPSDQKKSELVGKTPSSRTASGKFHGARGNGYEVDQIFVQESNLELQSMSLKATQIKKPWNLSSKVVLFSNPTFDPTTKQSKVHTKNWIGRRLSFEGSGLKKLSQGLRSSSAGKSLPALISALPSRRKSVDASHLQAESFAADRLSVAEGGELPLPPGRLHKARESGLSQRAVLCSAAPPVKEPLSRKGPETCKLRVRDSNVEKLDVSVRGNGQIGASSVHGKHGKRLPAGGMHQAEGCEEVNPVAEPAIPGSPQEELTATPCHGFESPLHPTQFAAGKENMVLAGCAPGVDFLRRSWSQGNNRFAALSKSPAGRSLLKRAKGWMSFQESSRRRDSLGRACSTRH